jgi:hypothetical protein
MCIPNSSWHFITKTLYQGKNSQTKVIRDYKVERCNFIFNEARKNLN